MRIFNKDLVNSNKRDYELNEMYYWIMDAEEIDTVTDLGMQKAWIDKMIYTEENLYNLEEKIREQDYWDILLEIESSVEKKTPWWAIDNKKETDLLSYFVAPAGRLYIINYPELRKAIQENLPTLLKRCPIKDAKTVVWDWYYTTRNISITASMIHKLGVEINTYYLSDFI